MSFVTTVPDLIETAAGDLTGIGSTVGAATAAAAPSTTSVAAAAADEVSAAIAAAFGQHGKEFQALSARVEAFHDQFVRSLNSGAQAYAGAEAANVATAASSLADIAGPYQQLWANSVANLELLGTALSANPVPFLKQFLTNQTGYAQTVVAAIEGAIQGFPAGIPGFIQGVVQAIENFDLAANVQLLINNTIGYAQTIGSALSNSAMDFWTGLQALPASFQSAFQALQTGDISGAVGDIASGFVNLFVTGIDVQTIGGNGVTSFVVSLTPTGSVGDLLPILTVPGQIAQDFTDALPSGSIFQQASQNLTNVINTVTDTRIIADASVATNSIPFPPTAFLSITNFYGMPVQLLLDGLGAPYNALTALNTSVSAITGALQTGDFGGAFGALIDAPAVVTDGFLNGQQFLPITFDISGHTGLINLPLNGLLVPATPYTGSFTVTLPPPFGTLTLTGNVAGTPLSGLVPALFTFVPAELAGAIGH